MKTLEKIRLGLKLTLYTILVFIMIIPITVIPEDMTGGTMLLWLLFGFLAVCAYHLLTKLDREWKIMDNIEDELDHLFNRKGQADKERK